ncbi:hypothetical protein [Phyllobacterium zundukense]|uniref:Uncharacterized protein n=1 Tax=Phyllobacterium zundukense TaxID=1867719 RepID=A0A2N9VS47_9HYPH|nr:hypothetical protein [Phyllobacterium zundukense]ATU92738.1 hypothetical protein BLM14_14695 [Phyllobacterium zundukense]PIO42315.1 hypothetical protein B5P45_25150 [Phyllobacterium zundukense]
MVTTYQAVGAISARVGYPIKRVRHVARELTEAGTIPAGAPGKSPEINLIHFLDILIGSALDVPLRSIATSVAAYKALGEPGHDASNMPASVRAKYRTAEAVINRLAIDLEGDKALAKLKIEIVTSWPEVAIFDADGVIFRFREAGALHGNWQHSGHRTSTTINGAAIAAAIRDLFGDNK